MKNKIYSIFALALMTTAFVSCDGDSDIDPIVAVDKPTMTVNFPTAVTANEGDLIPITFTLDKPVGRAFSFYIVMDQPNSTADDLDSDVDAGSVNVTYQKVITIPPFVTTYSDFIEINSDELAEGDEVLKLNVGETRTSAVIFQPVYSTITIKNVVDGELKLDFNFNRSFTGTGGITNYSNTLCALQSDLSGDVYDVDFIVYNAAFNPVTYPGALGAQTGACTEKLTMKLADYPNGLYHITAFLYENADLDLAEIAFPLIGAAQFNIPITVDYLRAGSINKGKFTQEQQFWFTSNTPALDEQQVVDIVISGTGANRIFTIQNTIGQVSASGKSATLKGKGSIRK